MFNNTYSSPIENGDTEVAHTIGIISEYAVMMSGFGTSYGLSRSNGNHKLSAVNGMNREGQTRWLVQEIIIDVQITGPIPGNNAYGCVSCHNAGASSSIFVDATGNIQNDINGTFWMNDIQYQIQIPQGTIVSPLRLGTSRSYTIPPELLELSENDLVTNAEGYGGQLAPWTGHATATIDSYTSATAPSGGGVGGNGGGGVIVP